MVFEVIVPEGAIAVLSQRWSQRGAFGDATQALGAFDLQQVLVIALISVTFITSNHWIVLGSLCVAPNDADGGRGVGLLSFSACCPGVEDCWMEEHCPARCDGVTGPGDKWAWGEACEPQS